MIRLHRCLACGAAQYPPREFCGTCLSDRLTWDSAETFPAHVVARTVLHHSHEPRFRSRLHGQWRKAHWRVLSPHLQFLLPVSLALVAAR